MRFPRPVYKGSSEILKEFLIVNQREEEARRRRFDDFSLSELFLNLSSRDRVSKIRVRRAIPARDDQEVVELVERLLGEAASDYLRLREQWQREAVGYLTSLGAEALSHQGKGALRVPDDLDYVGLEAQGSSDHRLTITARRIGNFAGIKASYLDLVAEAVGDYCFRRAHSCKVRVDEGMLILQVVPRPIFVLAWRKTRLAIYRVLTSATSRLPWPVLRRSGRLPRRRRA
jgi:hypothetical protein